MNEIKKHLKLLFKINFNRCNFHLPLKQVIPNIFDTFGLPKLLIVKFTGYNLELFVIKCV